MAQADNANGDMQCTCTQAIIIWYWQLVPIDGQIISYTCTPYNSDQTHKLTGAVECEMAAYMKGRR